MQTPRTIDVHGLSVHGDLHERNHDHFAIATLRKTMRLHQTNLAPGDDTRVDGDVQGHLFLIADGIEGAPAPDRASREALDSVVQYFLNELPWYHVTEGEPGEVQAALGEALVHAQEELTERVGQTGSGVGTTLTLALVLWPDLYVAHVGHSRCYLQRRGELRMLTTDHTLEPLRRAASASEQEEDQRHVLWNAVGGDGPHVYPEVHRYALEDGDVLAILTQGVVAARGEAELAELLGRDLRSEQLAGRLLAGRGQDDRTAIVVRFPPVEPQAVPLPADEPLGPLVRRVEPAESGANPGNGALGSTRRTDPVLTRPRPGPRPGSAGRALDSRARGGGEPEPAEDPPPVRPPDRPEPRETPTDPDRIRLPGKEPELPAPSPPPKPDARPPRATGGPTRVRPRKVG